MASIAGFVAVASLAVFASSEQHSFQAWSKAYYGSNHRAMSDQKVVLLPPIDDAMAIASVIPTADDAFSRSLRTGKVFRKSWKKKSSKYIRSVKRSNLLGSTETDLFDAYNSGTTRRSKTRRVPQSGLYRTMCVRSCDGFMWPVSFSTTKSNFKVDERVCRSSCAAPTRLYYYENPGQEPSDMVDRSGRSYNRLPTAWRYKVQHVNSCKCRPDPWEGQALARHAKFAALKKAGKLKRFLRNASRKAKRLSRRASIGHIVVNSSGFDSAGLDEAETKKPKRVAKRKTRSKPRVTRLKRVRAKRVRRSKPKWGVAKGFTKSFGGGVASIRRKAFMER